MHRMNRACRAVLSLLLIVALFTVSIRPVLAEPFKSKFQRRVVGDINSTAGSTSAGQNAVPESLAPSTHPAETVRHVNIVDEDLQHLLDALRGSGMDTTALERFLHSQLKQIDTLEQPHAPPEGWDAWLVAIGAKEPPTNDPAELARWRDGLKQKTIDFWKRQLASGDHDQMIGNLRRWAGALGKFNQADQDAAQAAIDSIKAHQELTQDVAGAVPLLGEAIDILSIARGETLSGEKTSALGTMLTAASFLGPLALEKYFKNAGKQGTKAAENLEKLAEDVSKLGPGAKQELAKKLGMESAEQLDKAVACIKDGCFLAGTLVATPSGYKPIEKIQVGDLVLARDYLTDQQGYRPVLQVFPRFTTKVCRVTVASSSMVRPKQLGRTAQHRVGHSKDASGEAEEGESEPPSSANVQVIRCTPGHEFYRLDDDNWLPAGALQAGDSLLSSAGQRLTVVDVALSTELAPTWNFEVAEHHTYFVAEHADDPGIWVHNTKKCLTPSAGTAAAVGEILTTAEQFGIPDKGPKAFRKWFDAQSPADLAKLYENTEARDLIKSRLRHGGGDHEWLMVSRAAQVKSWGMKYDDIVKLVSPTNTTKFRDPLTGALHPHGNNSVSSLAHKELGDLIDSSNSFEQFRRKLNNWAEYSGYLPNGRADLPSGLRQ